MCKARIMTRLGLSVLLVPLLVAARPARAGNGGGDCPGDCNAGTGNVLELRIVAGGECIQPGETVCVELHQRDLCEPVRGYQAFLEFDPNCLQVVSITMTSDPYAIVIRDDFDNSAGTITLAAGINELTQDPTQADALLATICLEAAPGVDTCSDSIRFIPDHLPPTRFTGEDGSPVNPCTSDSDTICVDGLPPVIECDGIIDVQCPEQVTAGCEDVLFNFCNVTDNSDGLDCATGLECELIADYSDGNQCPEMRTQTYRVTDCAGNFAEQTITFRINDTEPPVIDCPDDVTIECDESNDPANTGEPTVTDNCEAPVTVSFRDDVAPGACEDEVIITRTWTAVDKCGNESSCTQTIHVVDSTPPVVTCPPDVTIECDEPVGPSNTGMATTEDNCDPDPSLSYSDEIIPGDCEDNFVIVRTWTSVDRCGNVGTCEQHITVQDTTPPTITCPEPATVQCPEDATPDVTGTAVADDNCDPDPEVLYSDSMEGQCPMTITRTWWAVDRCGNVSETCQQIIIADDTTEPECAAPPDIVVECRDEIPPCPADFEEFLAQGGSATDNCEAPLTLVSCVDTSDGNTCPEVITRAFTIEDKCGNRCVTKQTIVVDDKTPPEFDQECPLPTIDCFPNAGECEVVVNLEPPTATDNCGGPVQIVGVRSDGRDLSDPFQPGNTTVTWIATDECGNANTCRQTVRVRDTNLLIADIDLQGDHVPSLTRATTFELWYCAGGDMGPRATVCVPITYTFVGPFGGPAHSEARNVLIEVPCDVYDCVTAQDLLHTLRSTSDFLRDGTPNIGTVEIMAGTPPRPTLAYAAKFIGPRANEVGHWLVGGNLDDLAPWHNDDEVFIDILDFGVWSNQFFTTYGSGNTGCNTPFPHADIDGDRDVDFLDLAFIIDGFLKQHEPNCCGAPGLHDGGRGPVTRISVKELRERGAIELIAGDVNHDGWLDVDDMVAVLRGARPTPLTIGGIRR